MPEDFYWGADGALITKSESKTGKGFDIVISRYPIYLATIQSGESRNEHHLAFKQWLPHEGWFDIVVPARGVLATPNIPDMVDKGANIREQTLFLKYVRGAMELQNAQAKLTTRFDQFGWKNDDTAFLFGLDLYTASGVVRVVASNELQVRSAPHAGRVWIGPAKGGSLEGWQQTINRMFIKGMEPHAFTIIAGFAAVLMRFLDPIEGGAIVHLVSPESGTGKSNALIGAASVWGQTDGLGLISRDTQVTKSLTLAALGNLPIIHDELALRDPETVRNFIMDFTAGRDRMRASRSGEIRHQLSHWQTILISAANISVHDLLSTVEKREAAAWRVLEFNTNLPETAAHMYGEQWRTDIRNNSGYAGQVFLNWLLQPANLAWTKAKLMQIAEQVWKRTNYPSDARFWVRTIAAVAMAGLIVRELKLIEFSIDHVIGWVLENLPESAEMRSNKRDWTINALNEFFNDHIRNSITFLRRFEPGQPQRPQREPTDKLLIRYEQINERCYISCTALHIWLREKNLNYGGFAEALHKRGAILRKKARVTLAAGAAEYAGGQVWCVEIDLSHPAISGIVPEVIKRTGNVVSLKPPAAALPPESDGLSPAAGRTAPDA